jgi:hypothetical protein
MDPKKVCDRSAAPIFGCCEETVWFDAGYSAASDRAPSLPPRWVMNRATENTFFQL